MQNGQGNGRNNGLGRNHHHNHHGHGHHQGIKTRDPKLSINNGKTTLENSMLRSEEKERQRQEARALREGRRPGSSTSQEKNEAMIFTLVQVSPNHSQDRFHFSEILGDFSEVSKHHKPSDLIGVDHQPPTPAPVASAHLHDPDNYAPPPPFYNSRGLPDYHALAHRQQHGGGSHGGSGGPRPKPISLGPPHKTTHHHQKFVEEVKPSLKSGPGPGPGPGPGSSSSSSSRPPHQERGPPSSNSGGGHGRGRPRSHDRTVKDPQVLKIMSEVSDLKSPLSAILQTPRPDHQSSFTFPTPSIPLGSKDTPSGFRLPQEPHPKSGKTAEFRSSSVIPSKALESNLNDEFQLSEESDEEIDSASRVPETSENGGGVGANSCSRQNHFHSMDDDDDDDAGGSKDPPVSPLKNTDESSNSEDSSATDSESSSSDEEGKPSPPPTSPLPPDSNPWSLSLLFERSINNKDESLTHEVGSKGYSDPLKDIKPEPMPPSPRTVDEPAPPVVTTSLNHSKMHPETRSKGTSKLVCSTPTDESSDEVFRPTPKAQKTAGSRTSYSGSKRISPSRSKIIEPDLSSSSDDDDEEVVVPKPRPVLNTQPVSKSPKGPPAPPPHSRHSVPKKPAKRKREAIPPEKIKSVERVATDNDSDSDEIIDIVNSTPEKSSPKKTPSLKPPTPSSSRLHSKKLPNGELSSTSQKSPKKICLVSLSSGSTSVEGSHHKHTHKEAKYNGEAKRSLSKEREGRSEKEANKKLPKDPPPQQDPHALKEKKEKEQESKTEKKKKSRHESDVEIKSKSSERVTNWEGGDESVQNSATQRLEEQNARLCAPLARRAQSNASNKVSLSHIQYENGVPKLLCSIPCTLIDKLPSNAFNNNNNNNNLKGCIKEEKINKEVLEMRTSGGGKGKGKKKEKNKNSKSPPNEDETKIMALNSIYKKRQSSLEPEKIKREVKTEVTESQDAKSPLVVPPKVEDSQLKQEVKPQIKEESKASSSKALLDVPLKRHGSSSSLSSLGTVASVGSHSHSKKHKKEKRKDKEETKENALEPESSSSKRRKRVVNPEPEVTLKRSRDNSRESTRSSSSSKTGSGGLSSNPVKKQKTSHEEESHVVSPRETSRESARENRLSPHPRNSQRNASEERPVSSLSNEATHTPYQARPKQQHSASSQDKSIEEPHSVNNGGDTSEYHSLPSSEHGSSTYRNGEERVSPPLGLGSAPQQPLELMGCGQMYPPDINPSPGPSMDYSNPLIMNQEATSVPVYISYFERQIPEILKDNTTYLNTAKELKHQADKEPHRVLQTIIYLEAVLYFILTGESMECDPSTYTPAFTMYNDTFKLIRHVSSPIFKGQTIVDKNSKEGHYNRLNVILAILSLRCQSLLSLKLYNMKRLEVKETQRVMCDYFKVIGRQPPTLQPSSTPSATSSSFTSVGAVWGGSQRSAANNSPSSLSPTPSPAGSVGSEGSQSSSGYSTEETRQRGQHPQMGATPPQVTQTIPVPADIHSSVMRHCHLGFNLSNAYDMWLEADDNVFRNDMKDFFIELDHSMGPLTLHSSLRELVKYVQKALDKLKKFLQ